MKILDKITFWYFKNVQMAGKNRVKSSYYMLVRKSKEKAKKKTGGTVDKCFLWCYNYTDILWVGLHFP